MSAVVCNSGPLIALGGLEQLELLQGLFERVLVAQEVQTEIEAGGRSGRGRFMFRDHAWLRTLPSPTSEPLLSAVPDIGEAATISLAVQEKAELVLMDEVKGRKIAREVYHLSVVGTGRVLVEAKRAGLINSVRPLLQNLRSNGYWISDRIVNEVLRQAGE